MGVEGGAFVANWCHLIISSFGLFKLNHKEGDVSTHFNGSSRISLASEITAPSLPLLLFHQPQVECVGNIVIHHPDLQGLLGLYIHQSKPWHNCLLIVGSCQVSAMPRFLSPLSFPSWAPGVPSVVRELCDATHPTPTIFPAYSWRSVSADAT